MNHRHMTFEWVDVSLITATVHRKPPARIRSASNHWRDAPGSVGHLSSSRFFLQLFLIFNDTERRHDRERE